MKIDEIPNSHRLRPHKPHNAHNLYDSLLLDPCGVKKRSCLKGTIVLICGSCRKQLQRDIPSPPRYSLANNLWIDPVPWGLSRMTLPEQMLVALLYPRVFVFKLYNKSTSAQSISTLQNGMGSTVCTFELNTEHIQSMTEGQLMPRPIRILSSVITVTFVGPGKLSPRNLRTLFRVRRQVLRDGLLWLKHNLKYYGSIIIDGGRFRLI
jgi:hypothetical protein